MSNINIVLLHFWECKPGEKRKWRRGENKPTLVCTWCVRLMGRDGCLLKCRVQSNFECPIWRFWSVLSENILKMKQCMPISANHGPEIRVYEESQLKVGSRRISILPREFLFLSFVLTVMWMEEWKAFSSKMLHVLICKAVQHSRYCGPVHFQPWGFSGHISTACMID